MLPIARNRIEIDSQTLYICTLQIADNHSKCLHKDNIGSFHHHSIAFVFSLCVVLFFEWLCVCVCVHPICFALKLFSIRYKVAKQFVSLISGIFHLHFLAVASNLQSVWVGNQFVIFCPRWRRLWASLFFHPRLCVSIDHE